MGYFKTCIVASAMLLAACGAGNSGAASDGDEQAVIDATNAFYVALNAMLAGDPAPLSDVFSHADDGIYMGADGGYQVGWTDIYADWVAQAKIGIGGTVVPKDIRVQMGQGIAISVNYVNGQKITNAAGEEVETLLRASHGWRKEDGAWKMVMQHVDQLPFLVDAIQNAP